MHPRAQSLIAELGLQPHPEGGYYREVFRSESTVQPNDHRTERNALTAIYFLLVAGQHSTWHQVLSDEIWSHLEGDALELLCFDATTPRTSKVALGAGSPPTARFPSMSFRRAYGKRRALRGNMPCWGVMSGRVSTSAISAWHRMMPKCARSSRSRARHLLLACELADGAR